MNEVHIYTARFCPYCASAKSLLKGYCHAIETDFANQTTAAAMVTIATSKPISATAGNSTDPIALLRDGQHHRYKMLGACASCDRRKIEKNGGRDRDRTCDPYHVKVVLFR